MRYVYGVLTAIAVIIAAVLIFIYSGWYNVAATVHHWGITFETLETIVDRSVEHHSKSIPVPAEKDGKLLDIGFEHYHTMCRLCHGAPGYEKEEFAKGLYPNPPNLTDREIQQAPDRELFWVIQNGIKMTGMPAFIVTHPANELWGTLLFVRKLPKMTPQDYKALVQSKGGEAEIEKHHDMGGMQTPPGAPAKPSAGAPGKGKH